MGRMRKGGFDRRSSLIGIRKGGERFSDKAAPGGKLDHPSEKGKKRAAVRVAQKVNSEHLKRSREVAFGLQ